MVSRKGAVFFATAIVAMSLLALFALTAAPSDQEAAGTTTTTTIAEDPLTPPTSAIDPATWTVAKIESDAGPVWSQPFLVDGWVHGVFELQERLVFLGSPAPPFEFGGSRGLTAYESEDGVDWRPLATNVERSISVHHIGASDRVVVVSGIDRSGRPVLLRSYDGSTWDSLPLPNEKTDRAFTVVGVKGDRIVLSEGYYPAGQLNVLEAALPEMVSAGAIVRVEGSHVVVQGPLGLIAARYAPEDLGLTIDDLNPPSPQPLEELMLWSWIDGAWKEGAIDALSVNRVIILDSGEMMAIGYDRTNHGRWTSSNGVVWTRAATPAQYVADRFGQGFVGVAPDGLDLNYSDDLEVWRPLGLSDLLPDAFRWDLYNLYASEEGLSVVATAWLPGSRSRGPSDVRWVRNGYTILYEPDTPRLVVSDGSNTIMAVTLHGAVSENLVFDFEDESVTFLDPESTEPLFTFSFDELEAFEGEAWSQTDLDDRHVALVTSRDGVDWIVDDVGDLVGDDWVQSVRIDGDRIILVAWNAGGISAARIWVGTLP